MGEGLGMNSNISLPLIGTQSLLARGKMSPRRMADQDWKDKEEGENGGGEGDWGGVVLLQQGQII